MKRALFVCRFVAVIGVAVLLRRSGTRATRTSTGRSGRRRPAIRRSSQTLHMLTDVYGPRLTGSPSLKAAGEWAIEQMHAWGLKNGRLEPWDSGAGQGWTNERLAAHIVAPVKDALVVEALAWTPGTKGVVRGAGRADDAAGASDARPAHRVPRE